MILLDTNILSTFGRIDRLELLFDLFEHEEIYISQNVYHEIQIKREEDYARRVLSLISENKIKIILPTEEELKSMSELPANFGAGEMDSIAIAKKRGAIFITNEKRISNYCENYKIVCLTLQSILESFWKENILTKEQVKELMEEIELKDNVIITEKEEIFEE